MSKISKIIIAIMSVIIVGLLTSNIILIIKLNKKPVETPIDTNTQRAIGIYNCNQYKATLNPYPATIRLNKDMTCEYLSNQTPCKWSISDDEITITITRYIIRDDEYYTDEYYKNMYGYDINKVQDTSIGTSEENCKANIEYQKEHLTNPKCVVSSTENIKATLINNGILLNNNIFNKVK